jgi:hypothetical protein
MQLEVTAPAPEALVQKWTPGTIYAESYPEDYRIVPPHMKSRYLNRKCPLDNDAQGAFTPEFIAAVQSERSWVPDALPRFDPFLQEEVGSKRVECPHCYGTFDIDHTHRGQTTGLVITLSKRCPCTVYRDFWSAWGDPVRVPSRFRAAGATGRIEPSANLSLSLNRQAAIIKTVYEDTQRSYFLAGPPNTGKTHILTALYRCALQRASARVYDLGIPQPSVWRISASVLLDEHVAWEVRHSKPEGSVRCPCLTVSMVHSAVRHGFRPCLFLDEMDKITPSEFKLNRLMQIVDAVYEADGQVVATSNKTVAALIAKWGEDEAGTVLRRIGSGNMAKAIHFVESQA